MRKEVIDMIVVEFCINRNGELVNPCGSDHTHIMRDLKTARGARNRVTAKGYCIPRDAVECRIFRTNNPASDKGQVLLDSFKVS